MYDQFGPVLTPYCHFYISTHAHIHISLVALNTLAKRKRFLLLLNSLKHRRWHGEVFLKYIIAFPLTSYTKTMYCIY